MQGTQPLCHSHASSRLTRFGVGCQLPPALCQNLSAATKTTKTKTKKRFLCFSVYLIQSFFWGLLAMPSSRAELTNPYSPSRQRPRRTSLASWSPILMSSSRISPSGTLTVPQRIRLLVTTLMSTFAQSPSTTTPSVPGPTFSSCARHGWVTASQTSTTSAIPPLSS